MSTNWRDFAACLEHPQELFFPVGEGADAQAQNREAKAVCRGCPVIEDCLNWALDHGQEDGVWGGLAERERRKFGRRTGRVKPRKTRVGEGVIKPRAFPVTGTVVSAPGTRWVS
jgi:WhiB family redox-sensing transcriptional regulator